MRILFYVGYQRVPFNAITAKLNGVGGSEYAAIEIAERLAATGKYQIDMVGEVVTDVFKSVNYIELSKFKQLALDKKINIKYDLVIALNYINYLVELSYIQFTQSIFWMHNHEHFPWHNGIALPNDGNDLYQDSRMSLVVATSQHQADILSQKYNIGDKIRVIGNGINTEIFGHTWTKTPGQRFIYSSAPDRGLVQLIQMWPKILKIMPQATLKVFCPPYAKDHLYKLAVKYDAYAHPSIEICGPVSQKQLYAEMVDANFWLYPSRYDETFCITALEMMYARCTILSTDTANLATLLKNRAYVVDHTLSDEDMEREFLRYLQIISELDFTTISEDTYPHHVFAASNHWREKAHEWDWLIQQKTIDNLVDVAYVISLHEPDANKLDDWKAKLQASGIEPRHIEWWPAVNGLQVDQKYLDDHQYRLFPWKLDNDRNDWFNRHMTPGEIGCAISHLQLWQHIEQRNQQFKRFNNVLILEDDFIVDNVLTNDVLQQLPVDWDMLYLGRNALTEENHPQDAKIVKPDRSYNLHAYMLSSSGVTKLIQQRFERKIMPVDEFIQATYSTHARVDLHHIWADSKVYAVAKQVLKQDGTKNETLSLSSPSYVPLIPTAKIDPAILPTKAKVLDRLHPDLYAYFEDPIAWGKKFLVPGVMDKQWDLVVDEPIDHVYCMRFFNGDFCKKIIEEAEYTKKWTTDRHEFYPTTDMVLQELQFNDIFNDLISKLIMPMAINRFQLDGKVWNKMNCENFIAKYTPFTQAQLAIHYDASDLTTLVNLSKPDIDFTGGGTYFPKYKALYRPPQGSVSVHPGNITHKHGARVVLEGSRYIIVSFMNRSR